jgi:hypothetical protein
MLSMKLRTLPKNCSALHYYMCTTWGLIVESVGCYGMTNDDGDEVPDGGAC